MTVKPKRPLDLLLAPVAVEIDHNLSRIREADTASIADAIVLGANEDPAPTRSGRAAQIVELATRGVDLHGWSAAITADGTRLQLSGGSVPLELGLSAAITKFIEQE